MTERTMKQGFSVLFYKEMKEWMARTFFLFQVAPLVNLMS